MYKLLLFAFISAPCYLSAQQDVKLWYDKPASVWTEALPIGNGRLGAMVFGGINEELIQLNEATLWSGGPVQKQVNPTAPDYLPKLREALFNSDYDLADALAKKMQGVFSASYMPLGDLKIKQSFKNNETSNFYRDLNIQDAIAFTKFTADGVNYTREVFASAPDQVIVVRFTANKPKQLNININAKSILPSHNEIISTNEIVLKGKAPTNVDHDRTVPVAYEDVTGCKGMRFALLVKAISNDGKISTDTGGITIKDASEITLYLSAATSFNGYDKCPDSNGKDEMALATAYLNKAIAKSYPVLLNAHKADFHKYFNRVSLHLGDGQSNRTDVPTDERMELYNKGNSDAGLDALYFKYGRYLLISSSRTPNVPANLQGVWNKDLRPAWNSNYTTNINVQMNYWPAEAANLSEMTQPLFGLIKELSITGRQTAKDFYRANGWVTHHNSDIWALSNPVGDFGKGGLQCNWAMGANWLTRHLWEHYLYTGDQTFLQQTAYPIMKGAALFTLDWLVPDGSGHLVTAPSTSPENNYKDGDKVTSISIATTMDMGIVRDLFGNLIAAGKQLNIDAAFRDTLIEVINKLYPYSIGSKGQLQEWYKDFEDVEPHHRHVSHLYSLYPANLISAIKTPALTRAAMKTLEMRGDGGTGWSLAWKVNFWARLLDGNHAHKLFSKLLHLTREQGIKYRGGGGSYPNLIDAHPPFQIDGNFAGAAGLMEMLLQSQGGEIYLLPALPDAWKQGSVKGLVARGAFVINENWSAGKLTNAVIFSKNGGNCTIRTNQPVVVQGLNVKSKKSTVGYLLSFKSEKGKVYKITTIL